MTRQFRGQERWMDLGVGLALLLVCNALACSRKPAAPGARGPAARKAASGVEEPAEAQKTSAKGSAPQPPRILFEAPEFALTDQTGAAFGSDDLRGRVW